MGSGESDVGGAWVRDACTRPTARRPLRVAAFDELSTQAVRGTERVGRGRLRQDLRAGMQVAGRAAQLTAAEPGYCSFFASTLTATVRRFERIDEVGLYRLRGAKITRAWALEDTLTRLRQLGLSDAEGDRAGE